MDESCQRHDLQGRNKVTVVPGFKIKTEQTKKIKSSVHGLVVLTSFWWVLGFCTVLRLMDMTVMGGRARSLITVTRSALRANASTLHQLIGWLISSGDGVGSGPIERQSVSQFVLINDQKSGFLLTWCFDVQPAGTFNLPAEEKVLQERSVGAKYM